MSSACAAREDEIAAEASALPSRSDALPSRQRILDAASMMLGDRHVTMTELAAAARVGRPCSTASSPRARRSRTECWREPLEDDATIVVMAIEQ